MQETGIDFSEPPIDVGGVEKRTDEVCSKVAPGRYLIDGREIALPVVVRDASLLSSTFLVDAAAAQQMIAQSGYRVVKFLPGKAIVMLTCVDYRDNDLGDYNEGAINLFVTTPGEKRPLPVVGPLLGLVNGTLKSFIYRMPVDQEFTTHAGRYIWGFPKWITHVDVEFGAQTATGTFVDDGELVYSITTKTGGTRVQKNQAITSLAIRNGRAWKTAGSSRGSGVTFRPGGQVPEIGATHPLANELRMLGLPKKPLMTISVAKAQMQFGSPESVEIGSAFPS
ncbi:acetoacetate decarboxylase family protein [Nocardia sp. CNY236]|uniref:acetoacetate decarboxylase family protein n=1 Tax=Nocardia sp. CNY236 TaxID=1169152 RepID=UPI000427A130|nr:acetoacetate decarboxylase family protein [Nocardia sp. CNY236]